MFDNTHVRARQCLATHAPTPTPAALRRRLVGRLVATPVCCLVEVASWSSLLLCRVATPLAWLQRSDALSPQWCARIHSHEQTLVFHVVFTKRQQRRRLQLLFRRQHQPRHRQRSQPRRRASTRSRALERETPWHGESMLRGACISSVRNVCII